MNKSKIKNLSLRGNIDIDGGALGMVPIPIDYYLEGVTNVNDHDSYGKNINFKIVAWDELLNESREIGEITGRFFDMQQMDREHYDPNELLNDIDLYTTEMYESCKREIGLKQNIYMVDTIILGKEYRGNRFGVCAIIMLEEMLNAQFERQIGGIIVKARPIWNRDDEEPDDYELSELQDRCKKFWKRLGFQNGTFGDYMYFITDFNMREIYKNQKSISRNYNR